MTPLFSKTVCNAAAPHRIKGKTVLPQT